MALVTIIIPNYNHASFLERRIQSVIDQTFRDFEVIILDDASTDGSREIIEKYRDHPKVKSIVYNDSNSGSPFKQWAKGIGMVDTEWVWIAESDDYCKSDFLETLIPALSQNTCVLAFHEAIWVDDAGRLIKPPYQYSSYVMPGKKFIERYMLSENRLVNAGQLLFRRSALSGISSKWASYSQVGDYRLFCEILAKGHVYASGEPMTWFVRHSQAHSLQQKQNPQTIAERKETWHWLLQSDLVNANTFRNILVAFLAGLETRKKGLTKAQYDLERMEIWQLAETLGIQIKQVEVVLKSNWLKALHWCNKNLTAA